MCRATGPPDSDGYEQGSVVATLTGDDLAPVRDELDGAYYIDVGAVDYDNVAPPDYEVVFLEDEATLERLGYYKR